MYLNNINIQITHKQPCPFTPSHIYPILQQKKETQAMYNILNRNKEIPTGKATWNKLYNITNNDWKNIYLFPFNITKYPAMQWFQISINHNILVTNKLLYQMRIKKMTHYVTSASQIMKQLSIYYGNVIKPKSLLER